MYLNGKLMIQTCNSYTGVVLGILTDASVTGSEPPISQTTMLLAVQGPQPIAPCYSA